MVSSSVLSVEHVFVGVEQHAHGRHLVMRQAKVNGSQDLRRPRAPYLDAKARLHEARNPSFCERGEEAINLLLVACTDCDLRPHLKTPFVASEATNVRLSTYGERAACPAPTGRRDFTLTHHLIVSAAVAVRLRLPELAVIWSLY